MHEDRDRGDVRGLRLSRFADGMAGNNVYLAIGGHDDRVNTASCRRLARALVRANEDAGHEASSVESRITDDVGHTTEDVWHRRGGDFLLAIVGQ